MPPGESTPDAPGGAYILLVEDSPDDAYFFRRTLGKTGMDCVFHHVLDGAAAIELIRKAGAGEARMPNAIFLDLKMPIMNGFEVLQWIQQQPWADKLSVTVLSGSNQPVDRERAARLGASGYLVKPITKHDLSEKLRSLTP